jgi:nitrate reductase NapE component
VTLPLPLLLLFLEFPALVAILDCFNRPADHFAEGAPDRKAWLGWLVVAIVTVPILVGYGIVCGYYFSVVKRNSPASRS